MLSDQAAQAASAMDPFASQQSALGAFDSVSGNDSLTPGVGQAAFGGDQQQNGQGNAPPSTQTVSLTGS
jgi:hypothetical protein